MKVLQINNVYAEKSTGKITRELHQGLLQAGIESVVVYGRGVGAREKGVIRLCPEWYGCEIRAIGFDKQSVEGYLLHTFDRLSCVFKGYDAGHSDIHTEF